MGLDYVDLYLIHKPVSLKASILFYCLTFRMAVCESSCVTRAVSILSYFDTVGTVRRLSAVTTVASGYSV
jgi:diketogulonate reductase-like aldo/keto reductase